MNAWLVKYDGVCAKCGTSLRRGEPAVWDRATRTIHCIECPRPIDALEPQPASLGHAGASARREYEHRAARREADVRERWGNRIGGWIVRFSAEPQSIRAWGIGAEGEEQLGAALAEVPGLWTLNDRRAKGSKSNIDHIVVAPAGVFVVDAKTYSGKVEVRNVGGLFRTELRLYVGGRDRSRLANGLGGQVSAVRAALGSTDLPVVPRVTPVLCFIGSQWPRFRPPNEFEGVRLEDPGSLSGLLAEPVDLDASEIERIALHLARELPAR